MELSKSFVPFQKVFSLSASYFDNFSVFFQRCVLLSNFVLNKTYRHKMNLLFDTRGIISRYGTRQIFHFIHPAFESTPVCRHAPGMHEDILPGYNFGTQVSVFDVFMRTKTLISGASVKIYQYRAAWALHKLAVCIEFGMIIYNFQVLYRALLLCLISMLYSFEFLS